MLLQNQRVLVTGATSGIGRAAALLLAAEGAHVLVSGRSPERGAETVAAITEAGGSAEFLAADLADVDSVGELAATAGDVDVLVNNAGVFPFAATAETSAAMIDEAYAINVRAPFLLAAVLAPKMAARSGGSIVNVTTMVAEFGLPGTAAYGATKAAVASMTRTWAAEFGAQGVRVNAVSPGPTRTEGTAGMGEGLEQLGAGTALGRTADAAEIAEVIAFLASPRSGYVTGAVLSADGGRTAV